MSKSIVQKGRWLKEWFDEKGKAISGENNPFDTFNEPSLINSTRMRNLEGRLLTIIDATFQDEFQRKAQKSIVSKEIWEWWYQYNAIPKYSHDDVADHFPVATK